MALSPKASNFIAFYDIETPHMHIIVGGDGMTVKMGRTFTPFLGMARPTNLSIV